MVEDYDTLKSVEQLSQYMNNIEYGWVDNKNQKNSETDDMGLGNYILQSPYQTIENKLGICWDQVELERLFFENNDIKHETYFIVYYDNDKCPTHTFLIYELDNKWYWFENSWENYRGIYQYSTKELLLSDVKNKFVDSLQYQNIDYMNGNV